MGLRDDLFYVLVAERISQPSNFILNEVLLADWQSTVDENRAISIISVEMASCLF